MRKCASIVALCVVATCTVLASVSCGGDDDDVSAKSGADLYLIKGCNNCHGPDGAGMKGFAPTLFGKKSYWTREKLLDYLRDPAIFRAKDPRLNAQGAPYTLAMPTYKMEPPVVLEKLADHVLSLP